MNETFQKINDIYVLYLLHNKNKKQLPTKYSICTINKYIHLMEKLDIRLFSYLDSKEKKLTIGNAENLIRFCDPDFQYFVFMNETKLNKPIIISYQFCQICCNENSYNMMMTPCCNQFICETCLIEHFKSKMNDIKFNIMKCLFCNQIFTFKYTSWLLKKRYRNKEDWMEKKEYKRCIRYSIYELYNILKKYQALLFQIEKEQTNNQLKINDNNLNELPNLIDNKFFGPCYRCSPRIYQHRYNPLHHWQGLKIKSIPRECVNNENNEVILNEKMFLCDPCNDQINNEIQEIKKCPHCNIRTIRPNECNFVICQCQKCWCFLCGCRLINDQNGHNRHYYLGPGSGPYSNTCRYTLRNIHSHRPTFEMLNCDCIHCCKRNGLSLCLNIDCNESAIYNEHYCEDHKL